VLRGNQNAGRFVNTGRYLNLLDLVTQNILDELAEGLELGLEFFLLLLLILSAVKLKAFLGAGDELLTVVVFELLDHVFINGVSKVEYLKATFLEAFHEWRGSNSGFGFTSDVVDGLLLLFHASNVFFEGDKVLTRLGGVESEELSNFHAGALIFVDSELQVLGELFVEFLVVFRVLLNFGEHFKAFFDDVLLDNLKDLVLLERFTRNVKGHVFTIDNTFDPMQPFGDHVLSLLLDEDTPRMQRNSNLWVSRE